MKFIIDIDERAYKGCVKLKNNDDMGVLGFHLINATANGTPLSEELKKIKEEIGEAYPYFDSADVHWGFNICRDIIDKHLSELKGGAE